ncbi:MAG TPA: STAS domain-containing protein [Bacteroidia bacterium]|nr:STAS domain-containing protein [Bacteroidia bacterium]QQR95286.1 MAG: STAS domain-containing protein [Bacteroidota bacterium]MBP7715391.1 STAS domain-containing protein [Bacteroidia bacterium]MBP8669147.1 STAS domain-containing protein [Bacteroidia bacterium]HOZ82460.1 STAS domain-containing protein [Bacteroidia bacterium]
MNFSFTTSEKGNFCIIKLSGNLMEKGQANELMDEINTCIIRDMKTFVLDLADLRFMSSSGLTVLLNILTKSRKAGGDTIICNINSQLKSVFTITRLTEVFTITENQEAAIAAI